MSNNRLILNLDELRRELRDLPRELVDEGGAIVRRAADQAADAIRLAYPLGPPGRRRKGVPIIPGNLRKGVRVKHESTAFGTVSTVRSTAQHAHLYEYGTQTRQTSLGYDRGAMPARPTFVPIAIRVRHQMYEELIGLLQKQGLQVTGSAG